MWQSYTKSQFQKSSLIDFSRNWKFSIFHLMWQSWDIISCDSLPQNRNFEEKLRINFSWNRKWSIFHIMFDVSPYVTIMRYHLVWQSCAKSHFRKKVRQSIFHEIKIFDFSYHVWCFTSCDNHRHHLVWQSSAKSQFRKKSSRIDFSRNYFFFSRFFTSCANHKTSHHITVFRKIAFQKKITNRLFTKLKIFDFHIMFYVSFHVTTWDIISCDGLLQNRSFEKKVR